MDLPETHYGRRTPVIFNATVLLFRSLCASVFVFFAYAATADDLKFIDRTKIFDKNADFKEPSGLSMGPDGTFYSVSDNTSKLFQLNNDGDLVGTHKISGNPSLDLEGIAIGADEVLFLADETSRSILRIEGSDPPEMTRHPLKEMEGYSELSHLLATNPQGKGLEGITVDPATGTVFVVFENTPRLLVSVSGDLQKILSFRQLAKDAGFISRHANDDELDISGLDWEEGTGVIWMVSDEGRMVFAFNPASGEAVGFDLAFKDDGAMKSVKNAEGVVADPENGVIYIVTDDDKKSRLYTFELPKVGS